MQVERIELSIPDNAPKERIACLNWPEYPYAPDVRFVMRHNGEHLFLKFFVDEATTAALAITDNTPVCGDSCVELFIAPDDEGYYNFECNAIGTLLTGYRRPGGKAERAPAQLLEQVIRIPSLPRQVIPEQHTGPWELTLILPKSLFFRHRIETFSGLRMRANLYKCGDGLSRPHYLSWQPIRTEHPSFHQPGFFGELLFE